MSLKQNSPLQRAGSQARMAEGLHEWKGNSSLSSNAQRHCIQGSSGDGLPRRNTELLPESAGTELRKPKLSCRWNWWGMWRATGWGGITAVRAKGRWRKENTNPLRSGAEHLVMKDRRKGEVLDAFGFLPLFLLVRFALCFLRSQSLLVWWNEALCPGEDRAREHKPTGYTEVHRTRQVASEAAGGAGQYHCEDAVYHLGNTMDQGRFLLAGGKQTSHLLSGRARRRRIWGATGCSASFQALGRLWSKSSWKPFQGTWRRWLETGSAASPRANHACPDCLLQWDEWLWCLPWH